MTRARVPTIIPAIEIHDMMLMIFCFFFETKYRFAINRGKFNR
jgi:hypothetical protein